MWLIDTNAMLAINLLSLKDSSEKWVDLYYCKYVNESRSLEDIPQIINFGLFPI